jgi:hypothetical protein
MNKGGMEAGGCLVTMGTAEISHNYILGHFAAIVI